MPHPGPARTAPAGLEASLGLPAIVAFLTLALLTGCGPAPGDAGSPENSASPPLLSRPQLHEDQQAMPELGTFDALNPPQSPAGISGPLGSPGAPPLGSGALLGQ